MNSLIKISFFLLMMSCIEWNNANHITYRRNLRKRSFPRVESKLNVDTYNSLANHEVKQSKNTLKCTNIAMKAAQEAKAASDAQSIAGQQAAYQVKEQLAEKAIQAAKAAEAALVGKQQIVDHLEQQVHEAEDVVQEQGSLLQQAQLNVKAAIQAAQQAVQQLKMLTTALNIAQANAANSEQAAAGAQAGLTEKQQLVEAAKMRVDQLLKQLNGARHDFENTKQAAIKASQAAHEAKVNVNRP